MRQLGELCLHISTRLGGMVGIIAAHERGERRGARRDGQAATAKGRAVVARLKHVGNLFLCHDGTHGHAVGNALGKAHDVGLHAIGLERERLAGAEQTALDRMMSARDIASIIKRIRKAEKEMTDPDPDVMTKAMNRYDKAMQDFEKAGGYAAQSEATAMAASLGLPQEVMGQQLGTLSGGQRRRIELARILFSDADTLILDEPTNDLDITTLSILEDYLQSFPGPIIAVSHDRFFLDKLADTIFEVRPEGRIDVFTGNWSDWARKRTPPEEKKPEKQEKPAQERPREKKLKFSYNEQREFDTIDSVIAELDAQLSACRQEQESCGSDYVRLQALTAEQERLTAELDAKTERWVYLNDLKERIDAQ